MARPPVHIVLPGYQRYESNDGFLVLEQVLPVQATDESTSGEDRRKPAGWKSPTPYVISASYRKGGVGRHSVEGPFGYKYTGAVLLVDNSYPYSLQGCCNQAMTDFEAETPSIDLGNASYIKALNKLKDKKVDLGVAYGERSATARMVGDAASNIARAVRQVRRGEIRNAMRSLGLSSAARQPRGSNWTNNWLALQYGVKPMLSDIYGAADALSKRESEAWRVTAKASVQETVDKGFRVTPVGSDPTGFSCSAKAVRGAYTRIDAIPSNELLSSFTSLGLTNPLVVAYELVPYSFVLDWLWPLGDWLNSLDAALGYENLTVSTSTRVQAEWLVRGVPGSLQDGSKVVNDFQGMKKTFKLNRLISGPTIPGLPAFKDPLSLGHMANGLSLLAQAFRR